MSATVLDDLTWVTFGGDDTERCAAILTDCPAEAVAAAIFWVQCRCAPERQPLCVTHRDRTAAKAGLMAGLFRCPSCEAEVRLLRIEPIR